MHIAGALHKTHGMGAVRAGLRPKSLARLMSIPVQTGQRAGLEESDRTSATPNDAFVEFEHVQKSYDGETLVVKDLNLAIPRGEFLTMLGPSGSGKTTTLMMLAGFESPTHGEIRLGGRPINRIPPHKRGIGMVFQNYALFPHMTVAENLAFPLRVRNVSAAEAEAKVQRALDMVHMGGGSFHGRRPAQLSGGQQQRVALARALVFEPELVLMDEPLGALDKQLREHMQLEIKHIHENLGVTMVYVTHDQSEALTMSDRIAVFNNGEIQQLAAPSVLYEQPENRFVAQFIGENNSLPGAITGVSGDTAEVRLNCGSSIRAVAGFVRTAGERTEISIRPERVEIEPTGPAAENTLTGRVEEIIYLGDHIRTRVSLPCCDDFIVKTRNRQGARRLVAGEQICIGWAASDCRTLDAAPN